MKAILSLIISGALVVSGFGQTRNVLVGTNNAVVQPTNFWSADASNARTGLGLGTAATNPASAFQPASSALTNLASGNGGALTNLQATNLVGLIPTSNIPSIVLTSIGTITIAQGGTSATNAAGARQNLGSTTVGDAVFIATNAAAARTAIGALSTSGDAISLTNFPALLLRTNGNGAGLTNLTAANITGTVGLASNVTGTIAISNGGSGATTAGGARTNFGLGATNTVQFHQVDAQTIYVDEGGKIEFHSDPVAAATRTNLGLGATNNVEFASVSSSDLNISNGAIYWDTNLVFEPETGDFSIPIVFSPSNAAITRTNLGIPLAALTNTNNVNFLAAFFGANTNPVLVNTNGEVVSPTNFWQAAPITTTFIESQPNTNFTTNISAARFLHIHSLATNIVNVTNTIVLPTNSLTFEGDIAMVVHKGPTNSLTQVRQAGSTNNLITLSNFNEAVEFTYYNDAWQFLETVAFTAPIYFSGTNAAANAAASRTNLGLGASDAVTFDVVNTTSGLRIFSGTNLVTYIGEDISEFETPLYVGDSNGISFSTNNNGAATTRTNLGLGFPALTNTTVTNFQKAIFYTNTAPSNIGGNLGTVAAWIEIVASNGVTYKIPAYTNVP